jgi:hypothetical protein
MGGNVSTPDRPNGRLEFNIYSTKDKSKHTTYGFEATDPYETKLHAVKRAMDDICAAKRSLGDTTNGVVQVYVTISGQYNELGSDMLHRYANNLSDSMSDDDRETIGTVALDVEVHRRINSRSSNQSLEADLNRVAIPLFGSMSMVWFKAVRLTQDSIVLAFVGSGNMWKFTWRDVVGLNLHVPFVLHKK